MVDTDRIHEEIDVWMFLDELGAERRGHYVRCPFCLGGSSGNDWASVTPNGNYFTCWRGSCGVSGDVIALAQEHLGCEFREACEWLEATFDL